MPSPIGHSTGFNYGVRVALYHGLPLVLQDRWDADGAAALIERRRAATRSPRRRSSATSSRDAAGAGGDLSSLRLFGCGGATVPPELVDAAAALGMRVLRLYGSTEVLVATWNRPHSIARARRDTDGLRRSITWRSRSATTAAAPDGTAGEIFVRGPNIERRLLRGPAAHGGDLRR